MKAMIIVAVVVVMMAHAAAPMQVEAAGAQVMEVLRAVLGVVMGNAGK